MREMRPDGSWMNDVHVSDWSGTTVFAAIALYEAVHYHGHLLDDSTRNHWKEQLLEAGEFMMKNPQMYSRRMQGSMKRLNNVNYSASVTYALQALGEMFDRPDFKEEAHRDVVPIHFDGRNSDFFYNLANLCKTSLYICFSYQNAEHHSKRKCLAFTVFVCSPQPYKS